MGRPIAITPGDPCGIGPEIVARAWCQAPDLTQGCFVAGDVGLMGEVARAAQSAGAQTMGVIPVHLMSAERGKRDLTSFVITEDMHERKKVMFMNSDAIVVLPGGAGSLDEFFEVLTWAQIGLHSKPIILLDNQGYWQPLIALIDHVISQGFAEPGLRGKFGTAADVPALIEQLRTRFL